MGACVRGLYVTYAVLTAMAIGSASVRSEPEPMARPTRPKVFTSPDELRRYLNLVKDYYSLNAKARYGKRVDPMQVIYEHPLSVVRLLLAISRQRNQQDKFERSDIRHEDTSPVARQIFQPFDQSNTYYQVLQ